MALASELELIEAQNSAGLRQNQPEVQAINLEKTKTNFALSPGACNVTRATMTEPDKEENTVALGSKKEVFPLEELIVDVTGSDTSEALETPSDGAGSGCGCARGTCNGAFQHQLLQMQAEAVDLNRMFSVVPRGASGRSRAPISSFYIPENQRIYHDSGNRCGKCQNHQVEAWKKGHARDCPFKKCNCLKCRLLDARSDILQVISGKETKLKGTKKDPNCGFCQNHGVKILRKGHVRSCHFGQERHFRLDNCFDCEVHYIRNEVNRLQIKMRRAMKEDRTLSEEQRKTAREAITRDEVEKVCDMARLARKKRESILKQQQQVISGGGGQTTSSQLSQINRQQHDKIQVHGLNQFNHHQSSVTSAATSPCGSLAHNSGGGGGQSNKRIKLEPQTTAMVDVTQSAAASTITAASVGCFGAGHNSICGLSEADYRYQNQQQQQQQQFSQQLAQQTGVWRPWSQHQVAFAMAAHQQQQQLQSVTSQPPQPVNLFSRSYQRVTQQDILNRRLRQQQAAAAANQRTETISYSGGQPMGSSAQLLSSGAISTSATKAPDADGSSQQHQKYLMDSLQAFQKHQQQQQQQRLQDSGRRDMILSRQLQLNSSPAEEHNLMTLSPSAPMLTDSPNANSDPNIVDDFASDLGLNQQQQVVASGSAVHHNQLSPPSTPQPLGAHSNLMASSLQTASASDQPLSLTQRSMQEQQLLNNLLRLIFAAQFAPQAPVAR